MVFLGTARATGDLTMFAFDTDYDDITPAGGELLAELGVDRHTVRELAEDERAIRCPDRRADYPAYGFASLSPEPASPPPAE